MSKLFILVSLLSLSISAMAERNFGLDGVYTYQGDGTYEEQRADFVMFPGDGRNNSGVGEQNAEQPPKPWYAKLPKKTDIVISDHGDFLEIEHTSLFGAYSPSQLGKRIKTIVSMKPVAAGETVQSDNDKREIIFAREAKHLKVKITVRLLDDGDIQVDSYRRSWSWAPAPIPVTVKDSYTLKRK